jgi:hypothetical protein
MRTFIADIIPKIQRFSQRLDDLTKLTNQHWVSLSDIEQTKRVYIFRANNQLLISDNGIVEKGSWEYLGNNSLLLDTKNESYLLKHGFFDENVIALKLDSTNSYAFFVNETKYQSELNSIVDVINFLENKYLKKNVIPGNLGSKKERQVINPQEYNIQNIKEITSIIGSTTKVYQIQFMDGTNGEIFLKVKNNQAYYKEKPENTWYTLMHYYENFELCVNALNYFIKTGRRLQDGYISTYS